MRKAKSVAAWLAIVVAVLLVGAIGLAAFDIKSLPGVNSATTEKIWHSVYWRALVYIRKAKGAIPELSWSELWELTQLGAGFDSRFAEGRSLDASVTNPYITDNDHEKGSRIFSQRCAACHGNDGTGWHAPPLNKPAFKYGDSDLAIYKVLRDGISGTAMVSAGLSSVERWQVVGFVRQLQLQGSRQHVDDEPHLNIQVSGAQLRMAGTKPDEWLTYSGSFNGWHYSSLTEVTPANVSQLRVRWVQQFNTNDNAIEATPLVTNGVIFTTEPPANVVALDAKSGNLIWRYKRSVPTELPLCCGRVNRGLAIHDNTLFLGSLDGYLVAINANDGKVVWQTQVVDSSAGYTITGAPLIVNRSVVVGIAGGEYGIRGFLAAFDVTTGQQQWKFYTVPGPGDPGHETWQSEAWRTGGGPTWVTGSYDQTLDLLYWGVGNPSPPFSGDPRPGDNLFTDSVIALHASTGKLAWYFQFTPHDEHDWDSTQTPILADVFINGISHKVICWANRNGFYYVLDRVTGKFLVGTPFVEQTWAQGLDSTGRPILSEGSEVTTAGRLIKPGVAGGTNWQPAAFNPERGLMFVPATEGASVFTKSAEKQPVRGHQGSYLGSGTSSPVIPLPVVRALDVTTGARKWEYFSPPMKEFDYSGLLATAGGLVFGASGGFMFALDATNGHELWRVSLGGATKAAPISFSVDGHQVIVVSAGRALFAFEL
jgi:alcohol dehydrogenase (cytochrome c)